MVYAVKVPTRRSKAEIDWNLVDRFLRLEPGPRARPQRYPHRRIEHESDRSATADINLEAIPNPLLSPKMVGSYDRYWAYGNLLIV
jgi:hypothetical protein